MQTKHSVDGDDIVLVAPTGAQETTEFHAQQTVGHVLAEAVRDFGKRKLLDPSLSYLLVLGTTPLDPSQTLHQAGVHAGDTLKLRSKSIPSDGQGDEPGASGTF